MGVLDDFCKVMVKAPLLQYQYGNKDAFFLFFLCIRIVWI